MVRGKSAESAGVVRCECRLDVREQGHVLRTLCGRAPEVSGQHLGVGGGGAKPVPCRHLGLVRDRGLHADGQDADKKPRERG